MALDFHNVATNEYLFGLNDTKYAYLEFLFAVFKQQTGIFIDPYADTELTIDHQKIIVKIIDTYINKGDLNIDKKKTKVILEFRGLIDCFSNKGVRIKAIGD